MKFENYLNFTPLFYSEVSSSFMLNEALQNSSIADDFVGSITGLKPEGTCSVYREKRIGDAGSIDVLIDTRLAGREAVLLVECKVHDYVSTTRDQLSRYYENAREVYPGKDIYLIYLTQFTEASIDDASGLLRPPTLEEFERTKRLAENHERLFHVSWDDVHAIIAKNGDEVSPELSHILSLHKSWMRAKNRQDIQNQSVEPGTRDIKSYLSDIEIDITATLPFGKPRSVSGRENWEINIQKCTMEELAKVYEVVATLASSKELVPHTSSMMEEETRLAATAYLEELTSNNEWNLLSFYSRLFALAEGTQLLRLNGSGRNGFSILAKVKGKGQISLCTLWTRKQTVEFGMYR